MLKWEHKKDPNSDGTFTMEWADFLDGATIAASSWVVPAGVTKSDDGFDDNDSTIKIAGGTDGEKYVFDNAIVDSNGDDWERSVELTVKER